jgi:pentatricopeptide repeat protein
LNIRFSYHISLSIILLLISVGFQLVAIAQEAKNEENNPEMTYSDYEKLGPQYNQNQFEINAKRAGVEFESKDALAVSREFIRIDPSFYVGHLYEGSHRYGIAVDYIGFNSATVPLEEAAKLIKKHFSKQLKIRSSNPLEVYKNMQLHRDVDYLYNSLYDCYGNTEQTEKAWKCIREYQEYDLQDEYDLESYTSLAWMVHRNRFYTTSKFAFLKNSLAENEIYAQQLLDSSLLKIKNDDQLNKNFFSDVAPMKVLGTMHYRSMFYGYNLKIDSAQKYYDILKNTVYFPENNYGTFSLIQAKFKEAEKHYANAKSEESGSKNLNEYIYYQSIIDAYKNNPKNSITVLKNYLPQHGILPGYGWYHLAMARSLIYDGQYLTAQRFIEKAEQFKELHIGTTLGESHYQLSIGILKLLSKDEQIKAIKFKDKKWWYKPNSIFSWLGLLIEKYSIQYLLINQMAANPERDNVLYKIFSTESTISFDEVWLLMKDFSPEFFIKKFGRELNDDQRPLVKKYFQLFMAKLYLQKGDKNKAKEILLELNKVTFDPIYEKLYQFRLKEAWLEITKSNEDREKLSNEMYCIYPQITAFTKAKVKFKINYTGPEKDGEAIIKAIKKANIDLVQEETKGAQQLFIQVNDKGISKSLTYYLINSEGLMKTSPQKIIYTNAKVNAPHLKFALFQIGYLDGDVNVQ